MTRSIIYVDLDNEVEESRLDRVGCSHEYNNSKDKR